MIRLDGNNVLVADIDSDYGKKLVQTLSDHGANCLYAHDIKDAKKHLASQSFDLVISNYYLADGVIHHLIDWCADNSDAPPIFTSFGYPLPGEVALHQRHSIAEVFSKKDINKLIDGISRLLFDFQKFHSRLLEMIGPCELLAEAQVGEDSYPVLPLEISGEGIFLQIDACLPSGAFGVLKFSYFAGGETSNFVIPGFFEEMTIEGQYFKISEVYQSSWLRLREFLDLKQVSATTFLNRAAGY